MKRTCPVLQQNESSTDRHVRIVLGVIVLASSLFWLVGTAQFVGLVIGAIALITGSIGFCGLYTVLGISTLSGKKK